MESPSDKALDGQTTRTYTDTHAHTNKRIHDIHTFPPRPHCRVYIYLSLFFSFSALGTPQTSEGIKPSPPLPPLSPPLPLLSPGLGLANTSPRKPRQPIPFLQIHTETSPLLKLQNEGLLLPCWCVLESDFHRVLVEKVQETALRVHLQIGFVVN